MNDLDHERLREIEASAREVDRLRYALDLKKIETKAAKEAWELATERHLELCRATADSQDCADGPLLRRIEELSAEANGQPVVADAVTADHEQDEPAWHGEPVEPPPDEVVEELWNAAEEFGRGMAEPMTQDDHHAIQDDINRCLPDSDAEADALAKIEAGAKRAKGRKRSKAR